MLRRAAFYAYIGFAAYYEVMLSIGWLVTDKVSTADFQTQSALILGGVGALLIRPESKSNDIQVQGEEVTVTEQPDMGGRRRDA